MKILHIDHIGVAVNSNQDSKTFWSDILGLPFEGEETVTIPHGSQYGDTFRLAGQGIPSLRTNIRGDQIVQVELRTPKHLNKRQEELLREFSKIESEKFTSRIKKLFKSGNAKAAK